MTGKKSNRHKLYLKKSRGNEDLINRATSLFMQKLKKKFIRVSCFFKSHQVGRFKNIKMNVY